MKRLHIESIFNLWNKKKSFNNEDVHSKDITVSRLCDSARKKKRISRHFEWVKKLSQKSMNRSIIEKPGFSSDEEKKKKLIIIFKPDNFSAFRITCPWTWIEA